MTRKLLLEGGGPGHMAHPFDLEWVKTGKDLIKFFTNNVVKYITEFNPTPSVKIDGVNVSFKLVKTQDIEGNLKYEFAVDRGSMQPVDVEGITINRIDEKWPDPEHGMRSAIEELLPIFNAALDSGIINEEIRILGMDADFEPGKEMFFNTEYVLEKVDNKTGKRNINSTDYTRTPSNTTLYNEDLISIHGINQFYEVVSPKRGSISRKSREVLLNEEKFAALQSLVKKVREHSQSLFNIYGPEDTKAELATDIDFDSALNTEIDILLSPDNILTDTLGGWLNNPETINPFDTPVAALLKLPDGTTQKKTAGVLSKFIYTSILPDDPGDKIPLSELLQQDSLENRILAINGALFNHGTRLLGREVLKAMNTGFGNSDVSMHEGLVLRNEDLFGYSGPVKITGDFIVTGMGGAISKLMKPQLKPVEGSPPAVPETQMMSIGLVPMAAKPFHIGHMALIELASQQNDQVKVFVSLSDRARPKEFPIYGEQMQKIWHEHLLDIMPNNVDVDFLAQGVQPVRMVYEILAKANANNTNSANTWRVYSDPVDTNKNYKEAYRHKYFGNLYNNGQVIFAAEENPDQFTRGAGTPDASGTMVREYLNNNDFESFAKMMPANVDIQAIWDILTANIEPEVPEEETEQASAPPIYMGESALNFMFETIKEELEKQKESEEQKELEEVSSMAAGDIAIGGVVTKRDLKKQPSLIREEDEELVEETMNYLLRALL